MMTKEEVTSIVTYCQMHKVSYSKRLKELGVPRWKFYKLKSKYFKKNRIRGKAGFIELQPAEAVELPRHAVKDTPLKNPDTVSKSVSE